MLLALRVSLEWVWVSERRDKKKELSAYFRYQARCCGIKIVRNYHQYHYPKKIRYRYRLPPLPSRNQIFVSLQKDFRKIPACSKSTHVLAKDDEQEPKPGKNKLVRSKMRPKEGTMIELQEEISQI